MSVWFDTGQLGADTAARILAVHGGSLYAAGQPSGNIYRYDGGDTWTSIGQIGGSTTCLALYSFGGYLWAGTSATTMARWNGSVWENMGNLPAQYAEAMMEYNSNLYICSNKVYRWDGGGVFTDMVLPAGTNPEPLIVYDGALYTVPSLAPTTRLYKYDGAAWASVGNLTGCTWADAFAEFNGSLYVGAADTGLVFKWDGATFSLVDTIGEHVDGMSVFNGILYAGTWENGGLYSSIDGATFTKLGEFEAGYSAYDMAVLDGRIYVALSDGHVHFYQQARPLWQPGAFGQMGRHFGVGV